MRNQLHFGAASLIASWLAFTAAATFAADNSKAPAAPGLGDPGKLVSLAIDSGHSTADGFIMHGQDARQQLVITGTYSTGQLRDLTRSVTIELAPAGIAQIDKTGLLVPLADGKATITAKSEDGIVATSAVTVSNLGNEALVNFPNQIVPIFTKLGCNSGGCHGKASGQNGFKLSLLGFEPTEDYEHLVKEGRGRRLFPASPDQSLLLTKPIGAAPHGGGTRLDKTRTLIA